MTQAFSTSVDGSKNLCVQLDGRVIGWARPSVAKTLATNLRIWKTEGKHNVPLDLEIGFVPASEGGQYPGLFLFSSRARMMRPVKYLPNGRDDQVGSFEQVYMDIAVTPEEIEPSVSSHVEHSPTNFLSILANMTPFSDFNQVRRTTLTYILDCFLMLSPDRVLVIFTNARYELPDEFRSSSNHLIIDG